MTTSDGYILQIIHLKPISRIENKIPILLWHGLGTTSDSFQILEDDSLAFTLQQEGYDVWLGNTRGNSFSERHATLSTHTTEFWDFSYHEIGLYDVANTINYILEKTDQKSMRYIGFSQGATALLVLLSLKPEYNEKIEQAHLISPGVYLENGNFFMVELHVQFLVSYLHIFP